MKLTVITNASSVAQDVRQWGKQVPFAISKALNDTAKRVISAEQGVMKSVFDRPTPFTINSLRFEPASKTRLEVTILTKDTGERDAGKWLAPEAFGGPRRMKGIERSMRGAGMLPPGMSLIPGAGAKLDAFGNWSKGHANAVFTAMRRAGTAVAARRIAKLKAKDEARKRKRTERFFILFEQEGDLEPGIYERKGTRFGVGVRPVAIFTRGLPKYRRRFPFVQVAERVATKNIGPLFDRALQEALATAR